jgi:hypothetical protein
VTIQCDCSVHEFGKLRMGTQQFEIPVMQERMIAVVSLIEREREEL